MSAYEPPTSTYPIFDSLAFLTPNGESLTLSDANALYVARNNIATSNASSTSFAGDISVGNSTFDYASGTGLTIKTTTSGESIFANVLSGVTIKQKFELNPNHTHLYDAVRITDSSAPTNYTLLQQTTTTLNIDNQIAGSTTNIKTKTAGGSAVTNLALTSTTTGFSTPIILQTTTPTNTSGYLGYNITVAVSLTPTLTTNTTTNLSSASFTIPVGVYLIMFNCYYSINAVGGTVQYFSMGLSTSSGSFTSGTGEIYVGGSATVPTTGDRFVGAATVPLTVSAGGTAFFITGRSVHTGVTVTGSASGNIRYIRIA